MRPFRLFSLGFTFLITGCIPLCTAQHDPSANRAQIRAEQTIANAAQPKLTETGELPSATAGGDFDIAQLYNTYCATCHGANGDGNGPGAAALDPKPRDFTDKAWQNGTPDEQIATVIKDGGPAAGLSATMAPWGAVLNAAQLEAMVKYVRHFGK